MNTKTTYLKVLTPNVNLKLLYYAVHVHYSIMDTYKRSEQFYDQWNIFIEQYGIEYKI